MRQAEILSSNRLLKDAVTPQKFLLQGYCVYFLKSASQVFFQPPPKHFCLFIMVWKTEYSSMMLSIQDEGNAQNRTLRLLNLASLPCVSISSVLPALLLQFSAPPPTAFHLTTLTVLIYSPGLARGKRPKLSLQVHQPLSVV